MEVQCFMFSSLNLSIKLGALLSFLLPWKVGVLQSESNCRLGPETGNKDGLTSLLAARLIHPFIFNPLPPALENCFHSLRKHSSGVVFSTIFLQYLNKVLATCFFELLGCLTKSGIQKYFQLCKIAFPILSLTLSLEIG